MGEWDLQADSMAAGIGAHTAKGFVADLADFVFADFGFLACHVNG
jgi:hypothetical protein